MPIIVVQQNTKKENYKMADDNRSEHVTPTTTTGCGMGIVVGALVVVVGILA